MNHAEYEQILKNAVKSEIEAQKFYSDVAEKVKNAFLKELFRQFSQEEKKHRKILEGFLDSMPASLPFDETRNYKVADTTPSPVVSQDMQPADAFALAMKKEEEAMNHYIMLADGCTDPAQKKIFQDLAAMERDHKLRMENSFVDIGYPEIW